WLAVRARSAEAAAVEARDRAVQAEAKTALERDSARTARNEAEAAQTQAQQERDNAVIEKQRADNEAQIAQALNEFLGKDLLGMANPLGQAESSLAGQPAITPNPNLTVREALDRTAGLITTKFEKQPLVEAALHETVGGIYYGLGVIDKAQEQLELAVALRRRVQGLSQRHTLKAMSDLAVLYTVRNYPLLHPKSPEILWREVLSNSRRALGAENPLTRRALLQLLDVSERSNSGVPMLETIVADMVRNERRTLGEDNPTTLETIRILIGTFERPHAKPPNQDRDYPAAEAFLIPLLADQRR